MVTAESPLASHAVRVLLVARVVNRVGAFSLPFLPLLVRERGASVAQAGWVVAAFGLASIPSRLAGGRLADRYGTRATIVGGLLGCAVAQLVLASAATLPVVLLGAVLLGLAYEIYEPPSQAALAHASTPETRAAAFGWFGVALAIGGVASGLAAAGLVGLGLRWLFLVDAGTCLVGALLIARLLPQIPLPPDEGAGDSPWRDRRLLGLLLAGTVFASIYLQLTFGLPLTLEALGLGPGWFGLLLAVSAATLLLGQTLLRRTPIARLSHHRAMALGYVVLGLGLLATAYARSPLTLVAATVVWSIGDVLLLGHAYALVTRLAAARSQGSYLAAYGLSWGFAAIIAGPIGAALLDVSTSALWVTCAAAAVALAFGHLLASRRTGVPARPHVRQVAQPTGVAG